MALAVIFNLFLEDVPCLVSSSISICGWICAVLDFCFLKVALTVVLDLVLEDICCSVSCSISKWVVLVLFLEGTSGSVSSSSSSTSGWDGVRIWGIVVLLPLATWEAFCYLAINLLLA